MSVPTNTPATDCCTPTSGGSDSGLEAADRLYSAAQQTYELYKAGLTTEPGILAPRTKHLDFRLINNNHVTDATGDLTPLAAIPIVERVPPQLYAASKFRENGLAAWDMALTLGRTSEQLTGPDHDLRRIPAVRGLPFRTWEEMWQMRSHNIWDKSPYMVNFCQNQGLLELAHVMAHDRAVWWPSQAFEKCTAAYTRLFAQAIADVTVAHAYNLPLDPWSISPLPYHIRAVPTLRSSFTEADVPVLQVRIPSKRAKVVDRDIVYVSVAIEVGPDPAQFVDVTALRPSPYTDQYAYQPVAAYVVGWETIMYAYSVDVAPMEHMGRKRHEESRDKEFGFSIHHKDLFPPQMLENILVLGTVECGPTYDRQATWDVHIESEEYDERALRTPMMLCNMCYMHNPMTQMSLGLPPAGDWDEKLKDEWKRFKPAYRKAERMVYNARQHLSGDSKKEYREEYRVHNRCWRAYSKRRRDEWKIRQRRFKT